MNVKAEIKRALREGRASSAGGDEKVVPCPVCPQGKRPKLYVNSRTGAFICFRCSTKGWIDGGPTKAPADLGKRNPIHTLSEFYETDLGPALLDARGRLAKACLTYVLSRISKSEVATSDVRHGWTDGAILAPYDSSDYAVFPIRTATRELIGWVGRRCVPGEPKYYYPPNWERNRHFWGVDQIHDGAPVALVEGIFDALAGRRAAPELTWLALLGSTISEHQIRLLQQIDPPLVIVMLDDDAEVKARRVAALAGIVVPTRRVILDGHDPDSAGPEAIRAALAECLIAGPQSSIGTGPFHASGSRRAP